LYSFSFAPNPHWSRSFSPQQEIWSYLQRCAQDWDVLPHIRFHHTVRDAVWDEANQHWRIETTQGTCTATVLVAAAGSLSEPSIPALPGLDTFKGTMFHSARWDHNFELRGRRVAVIGTGASAVQFVPHIQPLVDKLYVFQRTPPWVMPRPDRALSLRERRLMERFPLLQQLQRARIYAVSEVFGIGFRHPRLMRFVERTARRHLEQTVPDAALRAKLTPSYTLGCKRVLVSNAYLPALAQPNVEVVTEGITAIGEHSSISRDGAEQVVDAIIFGTGFHVMDFPFGKHIRGRNGRTLSDTWGLSPQAHLGTTVAGFPNLF
jgi:cation diffusion facilitator CzcD-associated flavoprotein CzcO